MAQIRPLAGLRYSRTKGYDFSNLIAPPFDVLDAAGKAALQAKHPNNIVSVDLPHLPAKTVGPDPEYVGASLTLQSWVSAGILERDPKPAIYPYVQSFDYHGRTYHRQGFIALVKLSPFGQGHVIPHEQTYPDAIQDRLKLSRATRTQISPIFGMYSDPRNQISGILYKELGKPQVSASMEQVRNDLWSITDSQAINAVTDLMSARPVYIADGHHRYTMALEYQKEAAIRNGGKLPPNHPANFCMFVLVGMQDNGLLVLPTHRLIGKLTSFDMAAFTAAVAPVADVKELKISPEQLAHYIETDLPKQPPNTFGLYDGATKKAYQLQFRDPDVLAKLEPTKSAAWRHLDVAIAQRYLIDEVLKPKFAGGNEPKKYYVADGRAVAAATDGKDLRLAILLKSTPVHALEELAKANELMPPKSTYFFPKLATGLVMNPLE